MLLFETLHPKTTSIDLEKVNENVIISSYLTFLDHWTYLESSPFFLSVGLPKRMVLLPVMKFPTYPVPHYSFF